MAKLTKGKLLELIGYDFQVSGGTTEAFGKPPAKPKDSKPTKKVKTPPKPKKPPEPRNIAKEMEALLKTLTKRYDGLGSIDNDNTDRKDQDGDVGKQSEQGKVPTSPYARQRRRFST